MVGIWEVSQLSWFKNLKNTFTWDQVENWKDPGPGWWVVGCGNVPAEPKDWGTWRRPPEQPSRACRASNKWTPPDIFSTWSVSPNAVLNLDRCATKTKLSYSRFLILTIKGSPRSFEPWSPSVQVHADLDGKCKTQDGKHQVLSIWQKSQLSQKLKMSNLKHRVHCQDKNHIHYKSYRAHNPVAGRDRIVVDFDLIYLGDADIQVQADFHMY